MGNRKPSRKRNTTRRHPAKMPRQQARASRAAAARPLRRHPSFVAASEAPLFATAGLSERQVERLARRLALLMTEGRQLVLKTHAANSCIVSTRVAVEFLREGGFAARPAVVETRLCNRQMAQRVLAGQRPETEAEAEAWAAAGCRLVTLGLDDVPPQPGRWPGHLVCIVENEVLLDLSLDQADRPYKGIHAAPQMLPISAAALAGAAEALYEGADGSMQTYRVRPGDESFRQSPDWQLAERREAVLVPLRALLAECIADDDFNRN